MGTRISVRAAPVAAALAFLLTLAVADRVQAVVLYEGSLGTAPETQGWLTYFPPGVGIKTTTGGKTTLDSSDKNNQVGFSNYFPTAAPVNPTFPSLTRAGGFVVNFTAKLNSETHVSTDRAGLSLIVLSSDHQGVELGFWPNEVWAQSGPTFTHAEGGAFNTTAALTQYQLSIQGTNYSLTANGSPLLSGALRDYSSFGVPYTLNNYLFVGDDTTSATASFDVSHLDVVVPEPACIGLGIVGVLTLLRRRV
jgi:hypothetical protein